MKVPPRPTPPRNDYYMGMAFLASARSKDPSTQVGAYLVSNKNEPLSMGYNGPPSRIDDNEINWVRPDKNDYVFHAERNAIKYASGPMEGSTLYVTATPCKDCALEIVDAGIKKVYYFLRKNIDPNSMLASQEGWLRTQDIAQKGGVELIEFQGDLTWMETWLNHLRTLGIIPPKGNI